MKTYKELFLFLQSSTYTDIEDWLSCEKWKGKDKQEALLRLCARLGLLHKIKDFSVCCGNFNLNTIHTQISTRDIFFTHKNKEVCLNDKGDSSDLTGIHKTHPKHLLVCTSKCIRHISIKKLDIDYIGTNFKQYDEKGYTMTLGIVVKDAQEFYSKLERTERTTIELKKFIQRHNTIVIDWKDLNEAYHNFKSIYGKTSFQNLITVQTSPLVLRLHQKLCCLKTMRWKGITNRILWGHIQRSGKSYIIGGVVIEDSREKPECNYLVITTAPNETVLQYLQVFGCSQFGDFNVVRLDGTTKKPVLKNKNIIICSKQFLQTKLDQEPIEQSREKKQKEEKTRSVPWLKSMRFDMRFVDESHNGGTTELAQKTLDYYGNDSFTVYITATYSKPSHDYQIPREHWILWDLEDINLCKRIDVENNGKRLVEKHGDDMKHLLQQYSTESIMADFSKYPDLDILTMNITPEILPDILEDTKTNLYGWSPDACFLLKQGVNENQKQSIVYQPEFQNEKENLKLWHTIFGKPGRFGVPDNDYPDELVFMKRIEKICKNPMTSSRFVGDFDQNVILAFLPPHNIDLVSKTTQQLLEKEQVVPDYDILCINSKTTIDPKQAILDSKIRAKNRGKKGVLVLSGRQCSLGVTIDDCDIVLLLNSTQSYDTVFQMMFRCMTEGKGKKRGFVIDLNIHRMIQTILLEYASVVQPNSHPKNAIRYLLQERLINLNSDHWNPCFGHKSSRLATLTDSIYEVYSSRMSCALENLFKRMSLKQDLFSKNEYDTMKNIFNNLPLSISKQKKLVQEETLKKGLEKVQAPIDPAEPPEHNEEEKHLNPKDILRPVSIVISLLTIHDNEKTTLGEMFSLLENDEQKKSILLNQVRVWWGGNVSKEDVEGLIRIFGTYLAKDQDTTTLIRQVKELFCKNKKNSKELSKIIDKYLIPQENEKKKNAEVSTPLQLRQEMLETIPVEFWREKKKVLEPCSGKGGFLMDVVDKFMTGLKKTYPDEKQRYKEIVEDCLYFSDINGMNIFISRLLLDPCNEYKLNYNEGDTLQQLHIKEKWGVVGFDAIIGNPPYNNELWSKFVEWSLCSLCEEGLLLYVHPANWRKPHHKVGQKMLSYDILHLCIYDIKTTSVIFRCNVRVDWYLLRKSKCDTVITTIIDEEKKRCRMNIKNSPFIPNCNIELVYGISTLPGPRLSITRSHSIVSNDKKLVQHSSSSIGCNYSYPVITNLNAREKRIRYTDVPHKDHHKPKVVMSYALHLYPFYDEGNLSPTEHVFYQTVKDKDLGLKLVRYLDSSVFKKVLHSCKWIGYQTDHNIFHYLPDISENLKSPDASDLEIRKCLGL